MLSCRADTHEVINVNSTTTAAAAASPDSGDESVGITFKFSLAGKVSQYWVVRDGGDQNPRLMRRYTIPRNEYSVHVSSHQLLSCSEKTRQSIEEELGGGLPLSLNRRQRMVARAFDEASKFIDDLNNNNNNNNNNPTANMNLHVEVELDQQYVITWELQVVNNVGGGDSHRMVPTAERSIEVLKKVSVDSRRNMLSTDCCSVCLEDFSGRGDCEEELLLLLSMPCSHIFHGDCIRKWLRTSHYCPLCRFEMPLAR